jgi:hypothetical protein
MDARIIPPSNPIQGCSPWQVFERGVLFGRGNRVFLTIYL